MKIYQDIYSFKRSLVVFTTLIIFCLLLSVSVQASDLDSLRVLIRSFQNKIEQKESFITQLSQEFNTINAKIYEYKTVQTSGVASFSGRLRNALKASHQLADTLDFVTRQIREDKSKLQNAYSAAIEHIERKIQGELTEVKRESRNRNEQKKRLNLIKHLEQEKAEYAGNLQKMQVDEKGWKKITIEAGDTLRRLKLKAALLEDFEKNLKQSIQTLESGSRKNRDDKKTYAELLDFYKELDESLDDDQDIFDKSRIEELRDKIENSDTEFAELKQQMKTLNRDIAILKAKIEHFKSAISEKEAF